MITERTEDLRLVFDLFRKSTEGTLYRLPTEAVFCAAFQKDGTVFFLAKEQGDYCGFVSLTLPENSSGAELNFLAVLPAFRGKGFGKALLKAAEDHAKSEGRTSLSVLRGARVTIPWHIPEKNDGHPAAPGVLAGSPIEKLLFEQGFNRKEVTLGYYFDLRDWIEPNWAEEKRLALLSEGIAIAPFDPKRHRDLDFVRRENAREAPWLIQTRFTEEDPILVAADLTKAGLVVAYAGPLGKEKEGSGYRGVFAGFTTRKEYRKRGIATLLFEKMCQTQRDAGADFLSFCIPEGAAAHFVAQDAGCRFAARWIGMEKEL